jgi:hypothetical protein
MTKTEYINKIIEKEIESGLRKLSIHGGSYTIEEVPFFDGTVSYTVHYSEQGNDLYIILSPSLNESDIEAAIKRYLDYREEMENIYSRV